MDMLTFSKEREPDLRPANLNQVVADVVELMQVRADELRASNSPGGRPTRCPTLVFDPEGIHRAVLNVVTNAIDAAGEIERRRGRVDVATEYGRERRRCCA